LKFYLLFIKFCVF